MNRLIKILILVYSFFAIADIDNTRVLTLSAIFLLFLMLVNSNFIIKEKYFAYGPFKYLLFYIIFVTIEIFISGNSPFAYIFSRITLFFPILLFLYLADDRDRWRMLLVMIGIWGIVAVRACYYFLTGAANARLMAMHKQSSDMLIGGGYGLAVGSAILAVYLLELILWKRVRINVVNMGFITLLVTTVVLSKSTITILALFIGLMAAILLKVGDISQLYELSRRQLFILICGLGILMALIYFRSDIGDYIISVFGNSNNIVARRMYEVGIYLKYGAQSMTESDMIGRFDLLKDSIFTFLNYPIMGLVSRYGTNFFILKNFGIGGHGEIVDALAQYGLLAGIPYLAIYFSSIKQERKMQKERIGFGYIVSFIILFIFNPFLYEQSTFVLFLFIPLFSKCLSQKTRVKRMEF